MKFDHKTSLRLGLPLEAKAPGEMTAKASCISPGGQSSVVAAALVVSSSSGGRQVEAVLPCRHAPGMGAGWHGLDPGMAWHENQVNGSGVVSHARLELEAIAKKRHASSGLRETLSPPSLILAGQRREFDWVELRGRRCLVHRCGGGGGDNHSGQSGCFTLRVEMKTSSSISTPRRI